MIYISERKFFYHTLCQFFLQIISAQHFDHSSFLVAMQDANALNCTSTEEKQCAMTGDESSMRLGSAPDEQTDVVQSNVTASGTPAVAPPTAVESGEAETKEPAVEPLTGPEDTDEGVMMEPPAPDEVPPRCPFTADDTVTLHQEAHKDKQLDTESMIVETETSVDGSMSRTDSKSNLNDEGNPAQPDEGEGKDQEAVEEPTEQQPEVIVPHDLVDEDDDMNVVTAAASHNKQQQLQQGNNDRLVDTGA